MSLSTKQILYLVSNGFKGINIKCNELFTEIDAEFSNLAEILFQKFLVQNEEIQWPPKRILTNFKPLNVCLGQSI